MRKIMVAVLWAGYFAAGYATDARVIAMGRHDDFFMDETSILRNPADISVYPSMILGSLGSFRHFKGDTATFGTLRDPVNPYFGATLVHMIGSPSTPPDQSAKISIGALFNRHDELLDYVSPKNPLYVGNHDDLMPVPAGKIDLFLGCSFAHGPSIGIGAYLASQSFITGNVIDSETSLYKLNAGINWPVGERSHLDISAGAGVLRAKGDSSGAGLQRIVVAYDDRFYGADARLFCGVGSNPVYLVPQLHFKSVNLYEGRVTMTGFSAGLGVNLPLNHGLFWAGLHYVGGTASFFKDSSKTENGGKVSFGFEHTVWGNWLLLRAGGQKILVYGSTKSTGDAITRQWYENPASDGSDNDCLGLGLGIVSGNRLHVDAVVSEDAPYTIANLLDGPERYLVSRISARYDF